MYNVSGITGCAQFIHAMHSTLLPHVELFKYNVYHDDIIHVHCIL